MNFKSLSEVGIYCLHLVFKPLIKKSVKTFRNSWDLHKHRSLKHKCPKWVWEQGLMQLALYAERNQLNFTELRQVSQLISLTINLIIYTDRLISNFIIIKQKLEEKWFRKDSGWRRCRHCHSPNHLSVRTKASACPGKTCLPDGYFLEEFYRVLS